MNTYQMKYFLTTVSCLNMTAAAEKLNITQSALSRSISTLESELGVKLFIRDKRKRLRLTAAGSEVYRNLTGIYHDYETMLREVEKVQKGITGSMTIGFLEGQMLGTQFKEMLDAFSARYPHIELIFIRDTEKGLVRQLQQEKIDVAVMLELQVRGRQELLYSELFWLPTYMIAAKDHPFAGREDVALKELCEDTFIYTKDSEITEQMLLLCRRAGFEPRMIFVDDMQAQSLYLEMGRGIAGYNAYHSCFYSPNVSTFRVREIPDAQFVIAWNKNNFNPAIAMLSELVTA